MVHCSSCHRPLHNKTSIQKGIGPECEKKQLGLPAKARRAKRNDGDTDRLRSYDGGDIVVERLGAPTLKQRQGQLFVQQDKHPASGISANVPRLTYRHSPTGYNFGYSGSGPADLALNICLLFCKHTKDAERLYQTFKSKFIAPAEGDRLVIKRLDIEKFFGENDAELLVMM